ncbi:hypothetical protein CLV51_10231 [Chitinophaga niastensis]|uniref:Uncharacterized protein n=1 Tax=Chitinophaga niastensis TaxID=536980 RepID=A0A2P8HLU4_CHINA|nr:DUF6515 family protein [Chitinophaga niastensis]PSL47186.1 hypothetical protein CLV51_10231 [Chitinophaga niastensis]
MKNRFYILLVLIGLLITATVDNAYAQRGGHGGGGHFGGGGGSHFSGGRISAPRASSPRISSSPRVSAPVNRGYYHGSGYYRGSYGRIYHGGGFFHPWRRPYYYRYNPFFPPLGFYVSTLPFGYYSLGASFGPMYYYGGTYYESTGTDKGYKVVDAPMGAAVPNLPDGATEIQVDGNTYYELNGTYYQETMTDNGRRYIVVGKNGKIGDKTVTMLNNTPDNNNSGNDNIISQLPDNCRSVEINGQQLFLSPDGMYYQAVKNADSTTGYKVVGKINDN